VLCDTVGDQTSCKLTTKGQQNSAVLYVNLHSVIINYFIRITHYDVTAFSSVAPFVLFPLTDCEPSLRICANSDCLLVNAVQFNINDEFGIGLL
jgi:hypothetical protein